MGALYVISRSRQSCGVMSWLIISSSTLGVPTRMSVYLAQTAAQRGRTCFGRQRGWLNALGALTAQEWAPYRKKKLGSTSLSTLSLADTIFCRSTLIK